MSHVLEWEGDAAGMSARKLPTAFNSSLPLSRDGVAGEETRISTYHSSV